MSSSSKENLDEQQEGMRFRGSSTKKSNHSKPILDFSVSKKDNDNDVSAPLLSSTTPSSTSSSSATAASGGGGGGTLVSCFGSSEDESPTNNNNSPARIREYPDDEGEGRTQQLEEDQGVLKVISLFAKKVRCKLLDKFPVSFASKFAVPPPNPEKQKLLRKFVALHVQSVATSSAEAEGLAPRLNVHHQMIKALHDRLKERAPRCFRPKAGSEDEYVIDPVTLRGKIWGQFGFQGLCPSTDLRGAGALALEHLLHFVTKHPRLLERIAETPADHAPIGTNYPWAIASINLTKLLLEQIQCAAEAGTEGDDRFKDAQAAARNTTGAFHVGSFSAMNARRKLAAMLTDDLSSWEPPAAATCNSSFSGGLLPWTAVQFKQDTSKMDEIFGPAVGPAEHAAAQAISQSSSSKMTREEQDLEKIGERLAAVHVAACCLLHTQWLAGKRSVIYFNEVFKATAAKMELLFRDKASFSEVMNEVWKDF